MTDKNKTSGTNKNRSAPTSSPAKEEISLAKKKHPAKEVPSAKEKNLSQAKADPVSTNKNENTTPQAKPENTKKIDNVSAEKTPKTKEKKSAATALSLFSIALVIASGSGIYYYTNQQYLQYNTKISTLISKMGSLKSDLAVNKAQSQAAIQKNKQDMQVLITQQGNTIKSLQSAMGEMTGRRPNDWLVAEAEYLVNLAGRRLWLEHDVVTSTILMETADQRLAELNDPSLTFIRKAIAKDIQQLKSIKRIDVDGIVLRINSLQQEVQKLPLANAILPDAQLLPPEEVSNNVNDWKQNLKTSFHDFINQFITYRKREGNVVPLLTSAQTFYLEENMKAKLDQAITAVYRENGTLYDASLKTAQEWATRFFDQEAQLTKSFLATLTFLENQTIEVSYPQALISQQMISDLLIERLNRDLAALPAQESIQ